MFCCWAQSLHVFIWKSLFRIGFVEIFQNIYWQFDYWIVHFLLIFLIKCLLLNVGVFFSTSKSENWFPSPLRYERVMRYNFFFSIQIFAKLCKTYRKIYNVCIWNIKENCLGFCIKMLLSKHSLLVPSF